MLTDSETENPNVERPLGLFDLKPMGRLIADPALDEKHFVPLLLVVGYVGVGVMAGDWMRVPPEMAGATGLLQSGLRWQSQVSLCFIWFVGHFLNSLGFRISSVSRIETWLITQAEIGTYCLGVMLAALINRYNISCLCNNPFSRWLSSVWKDLETWAPSSCGFVIP